MAIITSNQVSVTIQGVSSYSYSVSLSASPTTLSSSGGTVTLTATVMNTTTNTAVANCPVTFTEITTGTTASGITNSSGVATQQFSISANTSTSPETIYFQASIDTTQIPAGE